MRIGIAAVQGAVSEHVQAIETANRRLGLKAQAVPVRTREQFKTTDALIIPGGESTAISRLFSREGLHEAIRERVESEDYPVLGTCAGMVMLAKEGDDQVTRTQTQQLGLMDFAVHRNAFGRQRESFERTVRLELIGSDEPMDVAAVFIRAPSATRSWGTARPIAQIDGKTVAVRQDRLIALSFHPELTPDTQVHEAFLRLVAE